MNWRHVEENWRDFQGKVLQQWSKLTNDDLDQVKGQRAALSGKLQERYHIARKVAEQQIENWMRAVGEQTGTDRKEAEFIPGAYEHWFEDMMDVQRQSIELMSQQICKVAAVPVRFAECRNPSDVAEVQAEFVSTMVSDYLDASSRMLTALTDVTKNFVQEQTEAVGQLSQELKGGNGR